MSIFMKTLSIPAPSRDLAPRRTAMQRHCVHGAFPYSRVLVADLGFTIPARTVPFPALATPFPSSHDSALVRTFCLYIFLTSGYTACEARSTISPSAKTPSDR